MREGKTVKGCEEQGQDLGAFLMSDMGSNKIVSAMQWTQGTRIQSLGWEDSLEEDMATCSRILAGKILGTQ